MRTAEAMPPDHASTGITTAQLLELAYTAVAAAPASTPMTPPMTASRIDSPRNCARILPFVAPKARRRPISERRSRTDTIMILATPIAPTISATTPSPRTRLSNAPVAAARAVSTSDGWLTFISFGASGLAVRTSNSCTAASCPVAARTQIELGGPAVSSPPTHPDVAEVVLGGRIADQGAAVDLGRQR